MIVCGRARLGIVFVCIYFAGLLRDCTVQGKKTKDPTKRPTPAPSATPSLNPTISPLPSAAPTGSPSFSPTDTPSFRPSSEPTKSPTKPPTRPPTRSPTLFPTNSPTTTSSPTKPPSPFSAITPIVLSAPTNPPTQFSSIEDDFAYADDEDASQASVSPDETQPPEKGDISVLLPVITIDVILSDNDTPTAEMKSFFIDFLDNVLQETSDTYRFEYSHMESNGIESMSMESQLSGIEYTYTIEIDGLAYYFEEGPTSESLAQSLNVYFSFWGSSELEEYLDDIGFESAKIVSISVNGEPISFLSNISDEEIEIDNNDVESKPIRNVFYNEEGKVAKPVVVSLYVGAVIFIAMVALLVVRHRIGQRRKAKNKDKQSKNESRQAVNLEGDSHGDVEKGISITIPLSIPKKPPREPESDSKTSTVESVPVPEKLVPAEVKEQDRDIESAPSFDAKTETTKNSEESGEKVKEPKSVEGESTSSSTKDATDGVVNSFDTLKLDPPGSNVNNANTSE